MEYIFQGRKNTAQSFLNMNFILKLVAKINGLNFYLFDFGEGLY